MDIFGTAVTATGIIYKFLVACGEFSSDAKSLAARFKWDLTALEAIRGYLGSQNWDANPESQQAQLLKETATYLDGFADEVQRSLKKIEREGWLKTTINRLLWEARQKDLEKMQTELQYWTDRFGVRVLALPDGVRNVIRASMALQGAPATVQSNQKLLDFTRLASNSDTKRLRAAEMYRDGTEMSKKIEEWGDISFIPFEDGDKQLIFATWNVPLSVAHGSPQFEKIKADVCVLSAALNYLDPAAGVRLLKVDYCFYHQDSHQFLLAQVAPCSTASMMTLGEMISNSAFPETEAALDERLKLAHKLAEAVVFLHAAGFLHKNITSSSAVALRKSRPRRAKRPASTSGPNALKPPPPRPLDEVYLMGFELVRGIESRTYKEGTAVFGPEPTTGGDDAVQRVDSASIWTRAIYMHPERLKGADSPKYQKSHDIYSLGVVLLEIGLWEPLQVAASTRGGPDERDVPKTWPAGLQALATAPAGLASRMGQRYQGVVEWCLSRVGDDGIEQVEFLQNVLDPLEDMSRALA